MTADGNMKLGGEGEESEGVRSSILSRTASSTTIITRFNPSTRKNTKRCVKAQRKAAAAGELWTRHESRRFRSSRKVRRVDQRSSIVCS